MNISSILAQDKNVILYRRELNQITGSVTATILLQQINYWWDKSGSKPFYKFIAPCGHDKYRDGDSWVEELGFSKREFSSAFAKLEEKGLVSKRTNMDRMTSYTLNSDALDKELMRIYINNKSAFMETTKAHLDLLTETTAETTHKSIVELKPDIAEKVIQYLNKKTGKSFRSVKTHTDKINARIKEGATLTDLVRVIDRKCAEWLDDDNMSQYLRPATLFSAEKFNNYLGQVDAPMPAKRSSGGTGSSEIDFESRGWMS